MGLMGNFNEGSLLALAPLKKRGKKEKETHNLLFEANLLKNGVLTQLVETCHKNEKRVKEYIAYCCCYFY